jgi:hypothetical protein
MPRWFSKVLSFKTGMEYCRLPRRYVCQISNHLLRAAEWRGRRLVGPGRYAKTREPWMASLPVRWAADGLVG